MTGPSIIIDPGEIAPPEAVQIDARARVEPDVRVFASVRGSKLVVGPDCLLESFVVIRFVGGSGDIVIGEDTRIGSFGTLLSGHGIQLGRHILVAAGCTIAPVNHAYERRDVPIVQQGFMPSRGGVVVEDEAWIGGRCVLLDGAHVERGAIVAAGSVVRGRVPAYTIWGGVPARYIKDRP